MGTVTKLESAVWAELVDLCAKEQRHTAAARALWPDIAAHMAQLRRDFKSDNDFGAALLQHGIEYGKDDRAAFVWMGRLKPAALEDAMARCERRSPDYFKREVLSWGDHYFDPVSEASETAPEDVDADKSRENAPPAGESITPTTRDDAKTGNPVEGFRWDARSKLFALGEEGRLLHTIIGGNNAAGAIYLLIPKQRKFLQFIAGKMKAGQMHPAIFNSQCFHAQRLVPTLDKSFAREMIFSRKGDDKPNAKTIALFMDHFDVVLRAAESGWTYIEFLRATKGSTPTTKPTSAEEVWAQRPASTPAAMESMPKVASLADGTELSPEPIYVCGLCLFPSEARKDLSYVDAYIHAHDCREWVSQMNTGSVKEIGMHLAHRGLQFARQYEALGKFLSTIGTAIQSRGETMDRALWFKLEPFRNRTTT